MLSDPKAELPTPSYKPSLSIPRLPLPLRHLEPIIYCCNEKAAPRLFGFPFATWDRLYINAIKRQRRGYLGL